MNENVISAAFDYYTEQYREHFKYCEILDDMEERLAISGMYAVRCFTTAKTTLHTPL